MGLSILYSCKHIDNRLIVLLNSGGSYYLTVQADSW